MTVCRLPLRALAAALSMGACGDAMAVAVANAQTAAPVAPSVGADANASGQVQAVIVTAQKRPENIQNVPISVSAVSGAQLQRQNISTVQQLSEFVPNLQIKTSNNLRDTTASIRGIGSPGSNPGIETDVGIFIDGAYMPQGGVVQNDLLDIGTVEVLRGPQGTLYGRNTSAGAININTRAPTQQFEALGDAEFGNYGERRFEAYVGGGLTSTLAARVSVFSDSEDGYEHNLYNNEDADDRQQYGGRVRLLWKPLANLDVNIIGYDTELSSHCCLALHIDPTGVGGIATPGFLAGIAKEGETFLALDDKPNRNVDSSVSPDNSSRIAGGSLGADYRLANGPTLTSITSYNTFVDDLYSQPGADVPVDVNDGGQFLTTDTLSEELRVTSRPNRLFEYVAGLYGFYETVHYNTGGSLGPGANRVFPGNLTEQVGDGSTFLFDQITDSGAVFGQATFHLTPWLRVIGGGRYNYDAKQAYLAGANNPGDSATYIAQNPRTPAQTLSRNAGQGTYLAGLQADLARDVMAYFTASTGYKDGGFNARSAVPGFPLEFGPEKTMNYEVGIKSQFFGRRLLINGDFYNETIDGFQQTVYDSALTPPAFVVGNAGNIRVRGVELEMQAKPLPQLSVSGNVDYNDGTYTDFGAGQCPTYPGPYLPTKTGTTCSFTGLTPYLMPKVQGTLAARWDQPLPWHELNSFVSGDANYTGSQYLDPTLDPRSRQSPVTLLDAQVGVESAAQGWRVSLYGKNLLDKTYYDSTSTLPQAANLSGGGTTAAQGYVGWLAPPRTYGVELTKKF